MTPIDLICEKCKHFKPISGGCEAFKEIPKEIIMTNKHSKPLPNQKNKIVFEKGQSEEDKLFN